MDRVVRSNLTVGKGASQKIGGLDGNIIGAIHTYHDVVVGFYGCGAFT